MDSVECDNIELKCSVTSTQGISTKAELKSRTCASNNNFNQDAGVSFSTDDTVSALYNLAPLIDTAARNSSCPIFWSMCSHLDVFSDDGLGTLVSVEAIKDEVEDTVEFATDRTFSVESIQTALFVVTNSSATATLTKTICIFLTNTDVSVAVISLILQDSLINVLATLLTAPIDLTLSLPLLRKILLVSVLESKLSPL